MMKPQRTPRALRNDSGAPSVSSVVNPFDNSAFHLPPSALTLIELLVVIVILTTLVGGVVPLLSPNNDVRKIQAASRGLKSFITLVQAQAARTGRPQGIAFRESSPESGVALEVFGWEVPPPFAGFSTASYVRVIQEVMPGALGLPDTSRFYLQFILADTKTTTPPTAFPVPEHDYTVDPLPPKFVRFHDEVRVAGTTYQLIDEDIDGNGSSDTIPDDLFYTLDNGNHRFSTYLVEPINTSGQTLAYVTIFAANGNTYHLTAPRQFQMMRQPVTSSVSPYQLPASIVIDMQGSVTEGNTAGTTRFPTAQSLYRDRTAFATPKPADTVGIMFSPTGGVDSVYFNSNQLTSVSRVVLLLGRIENGGLTGTEWMMNTNDTDDQLKEKQKEINWLNLDSRLLSIITSNGRAVVSEPAFVDARIFGAETANVQANEQLEAAHAFAHEMTTAK